MRLVVFFVLVSMGLIGCDSIDSTKQYIKQIEALQRSNQVLQNNIKSMSDKLKTVESNLSTSQKEVDQLKKENIALEKMSEERVRKFWAMYEIDA